MKGTILLVDDETNLTYFLRKILKAEGFEVTTAEDAASARVAAQRIYPDVVVLDIMLPDANGVDLLRELKSKYPHTQFVMMTAHASIQSAVETTRLGAIEYLTKPVEPDALIETLNNSMKTHALTKEILQLKEKSGAFSTRAAEVTLLHYTSAAMRRVLDEATKAAQSSTTVLLTGESGTGKNYLARWIHNNSSQADGPFFDVNCAAIMPSLVESELFGYEAGAFTGSRGRKRGLLEMANGGTLLLDEIGDMSLALQAKLLSFFDTQTIRRLGGETSIAVNTRVIAATNQNLESLIEKKLFRRDLYYRLHVYTIRVPPLRERRQDIAHLATRLLVQLAREMDVKETPVLGPEAQQQLIDYDWPGNVRELRNVLERTLLEKGDESYLNSIYWGSQSGAPPAPEPAAGPGLRLDFPEEGVSLKKTLARVTQDLIREALRRAGTKTAAAALLGISRHSLNHYIKRFQFKT